MPCPHLSELTAVQLPDQPAVCEECIQMDGVWVHLRTCQTCGTTLCCDSSPNQHATKHFHKTEHPVVASAEPNERWLWCYADEEMARY
ncbi:UBP-type zinc finger domain-containing protein [Spirosoma pomorum]